MRILITNYLSVACHMRLSFKQLKVMDVETVSGVKLGKVHDLVCEIDGQLIAQYEVHSSMIGGKVYLVSRDHVVRFEEKKIIVDDSIEGVVKREEKIPPISVTPTPAVLRE